MSYTIVLDDTLRLTTPQSGPGKRLVRFLRERLGDHPDLKPVFDRREEWNGMDTWRFDEVSVEGLRAMQRALDRTSSDVPEVISEIPEEFRAPYQEAFSALGQLVAKRIRHLEGEGITGNRL